MLPLSMMPVVMPSDTFLVPGFCCLPERGAGHQTLGEEYCDISQFASSHGLPPTPARRALFIVYETIIPYLAERISSKMAARGIILADSQFGELYGSDHPRRNQVQSSDAAESSTSTSVPISALSKFRERLDGLWLQAIQKWPTVLPYAREILQLALCTNLMFFYFEGLYYHISKCAAGIRYVFIGKSLNQRPRYQILGVFLLIQLCILGAEGLHRSNLSSIISSVHQTSPGSHQSSTGQGLPVLNEDGNPVTNYNPDKGRWAADSLAVPEPQGSGGISKCTLSQYSPASYSHAMLSCLLLELHYGMECPICRTPITHSSLVCI
ncbi:peroxisome biogenesis factor 10-like isoform X2 [Elaeis guineensis]|uniref:peroxisome biogenesis factor 10-like isoform X2 n=1 Tax=Elaeis guineensis var. tenera TaxID=51953 RepID=UPI003C6DB5EA